MPIATGTTAPEFSLTDLAGTKVVLYDTLSLFPVLLLFFRSDCPLAQWALPQLARFQLAFEGADIEIYTVTTDPGPVARATIDGHRLPLQTLLDEDGAVTKAFGIEQLPAAVFVQNDGTVLDAVQGWDAEGYTRLSREAHRYIGWISGPAFGGTWQGDPCPVTA